MEFNEDLATIHGYLCADGYVIRNPDDQRHKYYVIGFRNQSIVLLRDFQKRFMRVFNQRPRMRKDGRCVVNSKDIYERLTSRWSFYCEEWSIPPLIKRYLRVWLRAFFDCEAWIELNGRVNRRIGLDSKNQKGIWQIEEALKSMGVVSLLKKRRNNGIYRLQIFGKKNIIRFAQEIGFLHAKKCEKLAEVINSYPNYLWEFPKNKASQKDFIKKLMLRKAKVKKSSYIRVVSNKRKNVLRLCLFLKDIYDIKTTQYEMKSGQGTKYYELGLYKRGMVMKALKHGLLNKEEIKKMGVYE